MEATQLTVSAVLASGIGALTYTVRTLWTRSLQLQEEANKRHAVTELRLDECEKDRQAIRTEFQQERQSWNKKLDDLMGRIKEK